MAGPPYIVDATDLSPESRARRFSGYGSQARRLVRAFNRQAQQDVALVVGPVVAPMAWNALKNAARVLHGAFDRAFGDEVDSLGEVLGIEPEDILVANLAYDLVSGVGCSTFAVPTARGPLHARNLDWTFPGRLLQDHTTVTLVTGPCGPYATVGWPGMFGTLTGIARGRFSVTVNFVRHASESSTARLANRALSGCWPVSWLVRHVLDEAPTFEKALQILEATPLLSPVLFTIVGTRNAERVVVERAPHASCARRARGGVAVTNHYETSRFRSSNVGVEEMDTEERSCRLGKLLSAKMPTNGRRAIELLKAKGLFDPVQTQHQVAMNPATGELDVRVPGSRTVRIET